MEVRFTRLPRENDRVIPEQLTRAAEEAECSNGVDADRLFVTSAGERACPPDHPYYLPNLAYQWYFKTNAAFVAGHWRLSSDDMMSQMMGKTVIPGSTLHNIHIVGKVFIIQNIPGLRIKIPPVRTCIVIASP